jgi:hypothetical protein
MASGWRVIVQTFENGVLASTEHWLAVIPDREKALAAVIEKSGHRTAEIDDELENDVIKALKLEPGRIFRSVITRPSATKQ